MLIEGNIRKHSVVFCILLYEPIEGIHQFNMQAVRLEGAQSSSEVLKETAQLLT